MSAPSKMEVYRFTSRTKTAARAIENLLKNERRLREQGVDIESALRDWAEEISGCGSEVQNLIETRGQ